MMPRAAGLWAVLAALAIGGCGEGGAGDGSSSTPAAIPSATATARDDFYATMDDLVTRLDRAVAAALAAKPMRLSGSNALYGLRASS